MPGPPCYCGPPQAGQVGAQPRALADAVYAYAANIDNLEALSDAVNRIAHKHASLGVSDYHAIVTPPPLPIAAPMRMMDPQCSAGQNRWGVDAWMA